MPDMSVLTDWNSKKPQLVDGVTLRPIDDDNLKSLIDRAEKLNRAIVGNLDLPEDYGIGQAYFMKIYDFCVELSETTERGGKRLLIKEFDRERLWIYHLKPLLDEYIGAEIVAKKAALNAIRDSFVKGV